LKIRCVLSFSSFFLLPMRSRFPGAYAAWRPETFNELDYAVLLLGFCISVYLIAKFFGFISNLVTVLVKWLIILSLVLFPLIFLLQLEQVQPWKRKLKGMYDESVLLHPLYLLLRDALIYLFNWLRGRHYVDEL